MEKIKWFLYSAALLLIVIPTMYVFIADTYFSSVTSNILISIAILLVILGKFISVVEKKKKNSRYANDIGAIMGLAIVLIIGII